MKSTHTPSDTEQAERQQLDEALAQAETGGPVASPNGTHTPRLTAPMPDHRERNGMNFYDEYVQTAKEEPQQRPGRSTIDDMGAVSFGPGDSGRWNSPGRNGHQPAPPINGYPQRGPVGQQPAPSPGLQPMANAGVPALMTVNDSVFTLLSEQVKELRQQKLELQGVVAAQEEKISELINLVHQLMNRSDDVLDQPTAPHQSDEGIQR